ncbi:MAG: Phospho-N-acetylmuramoyl-pentapeptide-transferase [Candidatus Taylorbacteria bacterium]|nr:Phospho-N-acetylmuramoyl-pentapeptide-transferase [Candidatus Taylorbacteria bacterium]
MFITPSDIGSLSYILGFAVISCIVAFLWAPILIDFLRKLNVTRRNDYDATLTMESRRSKVNTPVMGGLLIIVTVAVVTMLFNWDRKLTWVPIGVMVFAALLGGIDDILNIFGRKRRSRSLAQTMTLIRVHQEFKMRFWYTITLPWAVFKRASLWLGSHPGKGVYVHEKLLLQFLAGSMSAWWIYGKLGDAWHYIYFPFVGDVFVGWLIIPIIIFIVMFTANAVNIADGMDGLAGGMLITTFSALTLLSWLDGFGRIAILNATVVGALIAYTYFNIKPARFQMGDVGSLGIGALFAINALAIGEIGTIFFLGFLFYVEAITVLIQVAGRYVLGRRIFKMAPLHHHFELTGWSEEKTIMRFWIVHLFFVIFGVWLSLH